MRHGPLNLFSVSSILVLVAFSQSAGAQTQQRDNRPRTASISGRVTIAGKPAVNAVITVRETDLKPDAGGSDAPIPYQAKARTDGDGLYLVGGLAEGRYVVSAMLKAFVAAESSVNPSLSRTVTLDEGEARETIDFALIRGCVITGKVMDDEGAPLIATSVQLYTVDEQGQKRNYQGNLLYEMSQTDDRGVYRLYGLPPGRYVISAGGGGGGSGSGKFALTWHPDTIDEKQARIIEIEEGNEVTDVDIRFGSVVKTYEAAGRVVDRETGKPVPRINVSCVSKSEKGGSTTSYSTSAVADGQGNFRLAGLRPGRYQARIADYQVETGYTSEATEFEITNDSVSGVEVKVFPGATISGVVVIDGAAAKDKLQSISINPGVTPANSGSYAPQYSTSAKVNADGSFIIKGLPAGRVTFRLSSVGFLAPIKRIERDGVEIKDAIAVRPGEEITGVRITLYQGQGRIRGQVQITGGALPDGRRLIASARPSATADESKASDRVPVAIYGVSRSTIIDEKGRFVIEELSAGEYALSISALRQTADGSRESSPLSNQNIIVRENGATSITITIDLNQINQPNNRPKNQPNNQEDRR
ncbi:MAG TPA: carboxypeptidase regulatory-like domain-containing protein [Blastocatellia bacterium]|jgi:hypothetical protein|nr:carboxypeptidase regulatory-like domain-containing protein [Blastocatellia bacterium]